MEEWKEGRLGKRKGSGWVWVGIAEVEEDVERERERMKRRQKIEAAMMTERVSLFCSLGVVGG